MLGLWFIGAYPFTENSCAILTSLPNICFSSLKEHFSLSLSPSFHLFSPHFFAWNFTSFVFQWLLTVWFSALQTLCCTASIYPGIWYYSSSLYRDLNGSRLIYSRVWWTDLQLKVLGKPFLYPGEAGKDWRCLLCSGFIFITCGAILI